MKYNTLSNFKLISSGDCESFGLLFFDSKYCFGVFSFLKMMHETFVIVSTVGSFKHFYGYKSSRI